MVFSWAQQLQKAKKMKIRREKRLALSDNPTFRLEHPDEWRDAKQGKFAKMEQRVALKIHKHIDLAMERRARHVSG